ncbi:cyclase family protein [Chloroflexota bacterium]
MTTKLYDLSQLFWRGSVMWPRFVADIPGGPVRSFGGIRSTSWRNKNHPGWYDMTWPFPLNQAPAQVPWGHLHAGTHVDAPVYCIPGGITADKIPLENLYGTGVVLDFRHKKKWDTITAADLEKATPKIEPGDIVLMNTGWHAWLKPDKAYEYYHYYPGLVQSASEWLINKKIKAVAGTWPVCDHSLSFAPLEKWMPWLYNDYKRETGKEPGKEFGNFEGNLTMFLKNGISCIQNAGGDIDQVTGKRCTLAAWPFRLEETDGAMVRLVAIIEE